MDTPIDVDEDDQWKHNSEFVKIIKNMYGTCFIPNFSREIDWEWSQIYQRPVSQCHLVSQLGMFSKTHMAHVLYPVFQEKSIELVSDMSGAYKSYSLMVSMSLSITRKIRYEICAMCFENMMHPLVELSLVDILDIDGQYFPINFS